MINKQPTQKDNNLINLYNKYKSIVIVAQKSGIPQSTVYYKLNQLNIKFNKRGGKEKVSLNKLIELHQKGFSTTEIGKLVGIQNNSVWERLTNAGIKFNRIQSLKQKIQKIPDSEYPKIIKFYQVDQLWASDIAKLYNVHKSTIINILKKNNVQIRDNIGKNNPSWKGGITPLHTRIRNSKEYAQWRNEIFQDRNYVCEITGKRGGKLNVHHIDSFSDILATFIKDHKDINDENQLFNLVLGYKPFWDKDNTIVISENIHNKIHSNEFRKSRNKIVPIITKLAKLDWSKKQIYSFLQISSRRLNILLKENPEIKVITVSERQTLNLDKNRLQKLINKGFSDRKIAKEFNVAHTTIKRYKQKYKLT